jgi:tetraprenyl-beta-curcumene synthase
LGVCDPPDLLGSGNIPASRITDPAPLDSRQICALLSVLKRELLWGLRGVSQEVGGWHARAQGIPDPILRRDALAAIERKRGNIYGAALFWTLPASRSDDLLRLLVAYEILADFLDCASERGAHVGTDNGLQLHRALIEALDPSLEISDYYKCHPWKDDGGYLHALVEACRESCGRLPSYESARPLLLSATHDAQVLALNHEPDSDRRDLALEGWAEAHCGCDGDLVWFELTGGASAWLTVLALLALAAEPELEQRLLNDTYAAYMPWVSLAGTMLDSYGDLKEDAASADHSYIAHYQSTEIATRRVAAIVRRSLCELRALPCGERHLVIASCMIAMYLTKDSTRTPAMRATTLRILRSSGSLARLLMPALRAWRLLYGQRAA